MRACDRHPTVRSGENNDAKDSKFHSPAEISGEQMCGDRVLASRLRIFSEWKPWFD